MDLIPLLAAGAVAGTLAGLLGIGGGIVVVPAVVFVLTRHGIDPSVLIKSAIGTSLANIVVTATLSTRTHHRRGAVDWAIYRRLAPGIVAGSALGAALASWLPARVLTIAFVLLIYLVAFEFIRGQESSPHRRLPESNAAIAFVGGVIGTVSALLGVGGGAMSVPFLTYCSVPVKRAIGTAAAVGLPIAVTGTVGFVVLGLDRPGLPPYSVGYINLPALSGVIAASMFFAPFGARLAHRLSDKLLKRIFAVFLLIVGTEMARDFW